MDQWNWIESPDLAPPHSGAYGLWQSRGGKTVLSVNCDGSIGHPYGEETNHDSMPSRADLSCFYDDGSDDYHITVIYFFTAFATLKVFFLIYHFPNSPIKQAGRHYSSFHSWWNVGWKAQWPAQGPWLAAESHLLHCNPWDYLTLWGAQLPFPGGD